MGRLGRGRIMRKRKVGCRRGSRAWLRRPAGSDRRVQSRREQGRRGGVAWRMRSAITISGFCAFSRDNGLHSVSHPRLFSFSSTNHPYRCPHLLPGSSERSPYPSPSHPQPSQALDTTVNSVAKSHVALTFAMCARRIPHRPDRLIYICVQCWTRL